jgi:hypothetical protein
VTETYRISWEMVKQDCLHKYCNADPRHFKNVTQLVPNSEIPDEDWYSITTPETDDPWDQYYQLQRWAYANKEFVRNVKLERMVNEPEWEEVTDGKGQGGA